MNLEFQTVLRDHLGRYPLMRPQDCAKLAYQSALGPAHAGTERDEILRGLLEEWSQIPADSQPVPPEEIGNGRCRLYLAGTDDLSLAAPLAADLLCLTAEDRRGTPADLEAALAVLETAEVPGMTAWLAEYRSQGCPPVRHSEVYRQAYDPHYRVLRTAYGYCFPALLRVAALARRAAPAVVAIDGRCGSGKTSLAALIQRLFPCSVVHMDDFYLPPDLRSENWLETPGGNMDFARLLREVLIPAEAGEPIRYRPFDCQSGALREPVTLPSQGLTVVEGSYSQHPLLSARYDLKLFLTCGPEVQRRRLERREGGHFAAYESRWMPLEERYFQQCGPENGSDLVIDTSAFF